MDIRFLKKMITFTMRLVSAYLCFGRRHNWLNATVSRVMRRDIYTLRATGMTLADVGEWIRSILVARLIWLSENYVEAAKVNGFPIVVDDETRTLVGYIGSQQLRRAIGELMFTCPNAGHSLTAGPRPCQTNM